MQPGTKFKRGKVEVFGYQVPFAEAGTGKAIVSLPGSAGLEMSTAKDLLAQEFRVIELDPPGWGETPSLAGQMKQRHLATVLAAAIEEIGVERYVLIGTSMGGTNALWVAQQFPDRVAAMVLEGPMTFSRPEDEVNPDAGKMIEAIRAGAEWDSSYPAPPAHPNKPWATPAFFHEQMRRRFKNFRTHDFRESLAVLESFARSTKIPTTLVLGTQDEILQQSYAERLRSIMPNLKVVRPEGATHDVQNTAPETFVEVVRTVARA